MANHEASKQELEKEIKHKNLALLQADNGIFDLMVYNHENFAYRYLETSADSDIKCESSQNEYSVKSIEPDIFTALKWNHEDLKPILIDLCKKYPGKSSAQIKLQLELKTVFDHSNQITCYSRISWDFPEFIDSSREIFLSETYKFTDLLELRNKHATILEKVSSLF